MYVRHLLSFVVIILLAGCASYVPQAEHEKKISQKKKTIKNLRTRKNALEQKLKAESKELERVKNQFNQKNLELRSKNAQLERELSEIEDTQAKREGKNVVLTLPESILFDLGEATLRDRSKKALRKLGKVLKNHPERFVVVEGHADTIPITSSRRYSSNWDLSSLRAANVVEFLVDQATVDSKRLIAAGYGDQHPVVPNNSPENRQKNRRVEVVLYPPDLPRKKLDLTSLTSLNGTN